MPNSRKELGKALKKHRNSLTETLKPHPAPESLILKLSLSKPPRELKMNF